MYGLLFLGVAIVLTLLVLAILAAPHSPPTRDRSELDANQYLYLQVVRAIDSGAITVRSGGGAGLNLTIKCDGTADLPPQLASASVDGLVFASKRPSGQYAVAFCTWRGKAFNMRGYLYTPTAFTPSEIAIDSYGEKMITVGPAELTIDEQFDSHWYLVHCDMD